MKTVFATVVTSVLMTPAFCQNYYFVIGAFATENDNIREFTSYLPGQSLDTAYTTYDANNNMMHFFVLKTDSKEQAIARSVTMQQELHRTGMQSMVAPGELNLTASNGILPVAPVDAGGSQAAIAESAGATTAPAAGGGIALKPKGKFFKFNIIKDDGATLPGNIHQVDLQRGKDLGSFAAGVPVDFLATASNQPLTLVCGIFGYREEEKFINYRNPLETEGVFIDDDGAWVIPYKLERLRDGDVSVMYNVAFHKDAVVMLPPSKTELDVLVDLMQQNPGYVIKVHAHCNGKGNKTIATMGKADGYFDIENAVEMKSNAKNLTQLRAEAVRRYLADHGIGNDRVKIYGWGGADMLLDENHPKSRLNDRIEIEILED